MAKTKDENLVPGLNQTPPPAPEMPVAGKVAGAAVEGVAGATRLAGEGAAKAAGAFRPLLGAPPSPPKNGPTGEVAVGTGKYAEAPLVAAAGARRMAREALPTGGAPAPAPAAPAPAPGSDAAPRTWPAPPDTNPSRPALPAGGMDPVEREAWSKANPIGSVRATLPGDNNATVFQDRAAFAAGGGAQIASLPDASANWPGGRSPAYHEVMKQQGGPVNIFSQIAPAIQGAVQAVGDRYAMQQQGEVGTLDQQVYDRLGNSLGMIGDFMRNNDNLRSRSVEETDDGGARLRRGPVSGGLFFRPGKTTRRETIGDLSGAAASMAGHAAASFGAADRERTTMRGQDMGLAQEGMRQAGETTREGMRNDVSLQNEDSRAQSARDVADRSLAGAIYGADERTAAAIEAARAKFSRIPDAAVTKITEMSVDENGNLDPQRLLQNLATMEKAYGGAGASQDKGVQGVARDRKSGKMVPVVRYGDGRVVPVQQQ